MLSGLVFKWPPNDLGKQETACFRWVRLLNASILSKNISVDYLWEELFFFSWGRKGFFGFCCIALSTSALLCKVKFFSFPFSNMFCNLL